MPPTPLSTPSPVARFVLLGASNLTMGFPALFAALHRRAGGPVEVLGAFGHGRSYGTWSRILFVRWLPGITGCGLWDELARRPCVPTYALVTDVGNDLGYGQEVETVLAWVGSCLERLAAHGAQVVITPLPRARIDRLAPWQVRLTHHVFFPFRPVDPEKLLERVQRLDRGLRRLGEAHGARLVEPDPAWYGFDPIHIRRHLRRRAWEAITAHFSLPAPATGDPPLPRIVQSRGFPGLRAHQVRLFHAFELHTPQPACRYRDGSTVSLY